MFNSMRIDSFIPKPCKGSVAQPIQKTESKECKTAVTNYANKTFSELYNAYHNTTDEKSKTLIYKTVTPTLEKLHEEVKGTFDVYQTFTNSNAHRYTIKALEQLLDK